MPSNNVSMKALPRPPESTQLKRVNFIKKRKKTEIIRTEEYVTLAQLGTITVRKWAILPTIVWSQNTNLSLDDLFVDG